ncbi:helix-turn-helix transcriptional regulator [Clostridium intestinale]|uniref:helix-turn-helix domain-containing protein n=1 Tax=Clostridium intestinale TaxID=36845 RepID=UPI002DD62965|nr:helix-turn-helix transcriptional regulator [Clostridium intestinale]WRY50610.1 helix-turn-helix transcriptional regulator [Clostridium intestinale]
MNLGEKLKAIRKSKGLSLKELSNTTNGNISISFLSDIENGRGKPSIETLKVIATALNTPVSYFIDDSESNIFSESIEDTDFVPIVELLKDFKNWSLEDKKELLHYLKAKNIIRNNKLQ